MANKFCEQQNLDDQQSRNVGTGSADTTPDEFRNNIARDTASSFIGHPSLLQYTARGLGVSSERTRIAMLETMMRGAKSRVEPFKIKEDGDLKIEDVHQEQPQPQPQYWRPNFKGWAVGLWRWWSALAAMKNFSQTRTRWVRLRLDNG